MAATLVGRRASNAVSQAGSMLTVKKERPRLISDLSPDIAKLIENVEIGAKGNVIPKVMSKLQPNRELRQMLNIGGQKEREQTDVIEAI
jgi:hypothetical protein